MLAPDSRLELGPEGTIEMWISADEMQPAENSGTGAKELCVVQAGDRDTGISFRIAILPNGAGMALYRGAASSGALSSFPILVRKSRITYKTGAPVFYWHRAVHNIGA